MLSVSHQFSIKDLNAGIEYKYGLVNKEKPKDIFEHSALPGIFSNRRLDAKSVLKTFELEQRSRSSNQGYKTFYMCYYYLLVISLVPLSKA